MKKLKNILRNRLLQFALILLSGLLLGWLVFGRTETHDDHSVEAVASEKDETIWTCSMHPQIRMDKPGKCPICGMDLIPLKTNDSNDHSSHEVDEDAIQMTQEAIALANIQTTVVRHKKAIKDIQLYGTIEIDERLRRSQTSHVNGRIEELYVNFTGEPVKKGQPIAKIYSPDLLAAQQELLEAAKLNELQPGLLAAAKEKMKLWKITEDQISEILNSKTVSPNVIIYANETGVIVGKNVNQGDYINPGTVLYDIANLNRLWAVFSAYESDLPFLKVGDQLEYTLQSLPGKIFKGKIVFVNPIVDAVSRTTKVRVEVNNNQNLLKPEMFATAIVNAPLGGMDNVVVPKTAVLWTGKRSIIYVKEPSASIPTFKMREIVLGASLGDGYVVSSGVENGDEIVTNGAFSIDASAQLEGKKSMMNENAGTVSNEHQH